MTFAGEPASSSSRQGQAGAVDALGDGSQDSAVRLMPRRAPLPSGAKGSGEEGAPFP